MSEVVVSLRAGPVSTEARSEFMRHVAEAFDDYVRAHSDEPEALVMVFCGLRQPARSGWLIRGESEGGGCTVVCLAQGALQSAICNFDELRDR